MGAHGTRTSYGQSSPGNDHVYTMLVSPSCELLLVLGQDFGTQSYAIHFGCANGHAEEQKYSAETGVIN